METCEKTVELSGGRIHVLTSVQYAPQGLPRKDWCRLQRHQERRRCYHLQEG